MFSIVKVLGKTQQALQSVARGWLWFCIVQSTQLVLIPVGVVLLFVLAACRVWTVRDSHQYSYKIMAWRWSWIDKMYGNEEDGVDGARGYKRDAYGTFYYGASVPYGPDYDDTKAWYYEQDPWLKRTWKWPEWWRVYYWSAWRNSVNNYRFLTKWVGGPYVSYKTHIRKVPDRRHKEFKFSAGWNDHGFLVLFIGAAE